MTLPVCTGVDSLDSAPATSPWHLRDYNPSPAVQSAQQLTAQSLQAVPKRTSLGQPVLACSLQPSPEPAPNSAAHSDDDVDGCAMHLLACTHPCLSSLLSLCAALLLT